MITNRTLSIASALLLAGTSANAQLNCGTDLMHHRALQQNPDVADNEHGLEAFTRDYVAALRSGERMDDTTYVIPIVFHILWSDADPRPVLGGGNPDLGLFANLTDQVIFDQMEILNEDFQKLNADTINICCGFEEILGDAHIEFRLATKDPNGNCHSGIDRINSVEVYQGDDGSKINPWYQGKYLNIWTCAKMEDGVAGYAYYPSAGAGSGSLRDGIIILYDYIAGSSRALTHEIGHWLNLQHPWGNNNDPTIACDDDEVDDTPVTEGHTSCLEVDKYDYSCSNAAMDTIYTFTGVTTTSGTTDPTPVPTVTIVDTVAGTVDYSLVMGPFTAQGVSANSARDSVFAFTDWELGATQGDTAFAQLDNTINTAKYYQFSVTPQSGRGMKLTGITFKVGRDTSGIRTYAVRWSMNSYSANLAAIESPATPLLEIASPNTFFIVNDTDQTIVNSRVTLSMTPSQSLTPITFRIYGWNAEDPTGTFEISDVRVFGDFGIIENTQNFMDYSYCPDHNFTIGQTERMRAALTSSLAQRSTLWTEANLAFTGTDGINNVTCAPIPDFYPGELFVCQNTNVQFFERSAGTDATSFNWTFPDATPSTSTSANPTVQFNSGGWKDVTLEATNAYGTGTTTKGGVIWVDFGYGQADNTLSCNFDDVSQLGNWVVKNYEKNQTYFQHVEGIGTINDGCVMLNAFNTIGPNDLLIDDGAGDIDELHLPSLDFRFADNLELRFTHAYATQANNPEDLTEKLQVWRSSDCGASWFLEETYDTDALVTNGTVTTSYVPTGGSSVEWRDHVVDIGSLEGQPDARIKFVFVSSGLSNNLYIDNISFSGNVSVAELNGEAAALAIYPNPNDGTFSIDHALASPATATLTIHDALGRTVMVRDLGVTSGGTIKLDANALNLARGTYTVQLRSAAGTAVKRMTVR